MGLMSSRDSHSHRRLFCDLLTLAVLVLPSRAVAIESSSDSSTRRSAPPPQALVSAGSGSVPSLNSAVTPAWNSVTETQGAPGKGGIIVVYTSSDANDFPLIA